MDLCNIRLQEIKPITELGTQKVSDELLGQEMLNAELLGCLNHANSEIVQSKEHIENWNKLQIIKQEVQSKVEKRHEAQIIQCKRTLETNKLVQNVSEQEQEKVKFVNELDILSADHTRLIGEIAEMKKRLTDCNNLYNAETKNSTVRVDELLVLITASTESNNLKLAKLNTLRISHSGCLKTIKDLEDSIVETSREFDLLSCRSKALAQATAQTKIEIDVAQDELGKIDDNIEKLTNAISVAKSGIQAMQHRTMTWKTSLSKEDSDNLSGSLEIIAMLEKKLESITSEESSLLVQEEVDIGTARKALQVIQKQNKGMEEVLSKFSVQMDVSFFGNENALGSSMSLVQGLEQEESYSYVNDLLGEAEKTTGIKEINKRLGNRKTVLEQDLAELSKDALQLEQLATETSNQLEEITRNVLQRQNHKQTVIEKIKCLEIEFKDATEQALLIKHEKETLVDSISRKSEGTS